MSISLPALDRYIALQLEMQVQVLSSKYWNLDDLFLPITVGNPKYFSKPCALTAAIMGRFCWTSSGVFLPKKMMLIYFYLGIGQMHVHIGQK